MGNEVINVMSSPIVQFGFAGLCAVLLGIIVWLINRLLDILRRTDDVIASNTAAIRELMNGQAVLRQEMRAIAERILARPCIARFEDGMRA